jgi:hypothetical protein
MRLTTTAPCVMVVERVELFFGVNVCGGADDAPAETRGAPAQAVPEPLTGQGVEAGAALYVGVVTGLGRLECECEHE